MNEIAQFLEEEIKLNKKENWNKLDKTIKLKKLNDFAISYCKKHNYAEDICATLRDFLKQKLNQRRLTTNKDLLYDAEKMHIVDIPTLVYINDTFILNRNDKRHSTVKSLTPTKKN
jgi:hypothetical protein